MEPTQPLAHAEAPALEPGALAPPPRRRMPTERRSLTHKFCVDGHEGYVTVGFYDDGRVGELFLSDVGKEGSTLRGVFSAWATTLSIALQHGVSLETLVRKFAHMRFEPRGRTENPEIPTAQSIPDYIARWLASRFLDVDTQEELGVLTPEVTRRRPGTATTAAGLPAAPRQAVTARPPAATIAPPRP